MVLVYGLEFSHLSEAGKLGLELPLTVSVTTRKQGNCRALQYFAKLRGEVVPLSFSIDDIKSIRMLGLQFRFFSEMGWMQT